MTEGPKFLPVAEPDLGQLEEHYLLAAFRSGWISSLGEYLGRFEREFSAFCGVEHGVAVSNGTTGLHVALLAAGVGPGDEVILPALTFVATAAVVRHTGAEPVFVDSIPEIGTLDPAAVSRALSARTRAIIPVHLYGHPADMDPILEMARARKVLVIEDAAEAHGARYRGKPVGSLADAAVFSFYGNKILSTGEGGMVVTNLAELSQKVRLLKDHAMDPARRYWHPEVGYNYRMTKPPSAVHSSPDSTSCAASASGSWTCTEPRSPIARTSSSIRRDRGRRPCPGWPAPFCLAPSCGTWRCESFARRRSTVVPTSIRSATCRPTQVFAAWTRAATNSPRPETSPRADSTCRLSLG
jgi:hypothetical protein